MRVDVPVRVQPDDLLVVDGNALHVADIAENPDGEMEFKITSGGVLDAIYTESELAKKFAAADSVTVHR